ncbi:MAG: type II secretion system secretin GspD [Gemmatimonadota bacterium]
MRTLPGTLAKASATMAAAVTAALLTFTTAPGALAQEQAKSSDESVYLNFPNADLETVVRAVGQFTGRTFVIDPRVKGTLNLVTERPVNKQQAYEQLLAALRLSGFTIVESPQPGGIARILPEADAKLQGGRVVPPGAAAPRGDQVVTEVFQLKYESATTMVPVLRPLIAPNNTISAVPANNALVITDYADNLRRIARIIEALDSPVSAGTEMVPLKYGLAVEIATIANRVLDEGARAAGQAVDGGQRVQVLAEPRTNTLIIRTGSPARAKLARQLIERLDQPSVTPGNINVVYLRNAEATKLAPLLRAVLSSDPNFVPQTGGGGLSQATPMATAGAAGATGLPGQPSTQFAQPSAPAPAAGGGGGASSALGGMIQPDAATNSLIISAPEPLYRNIRAIIDRLDARRAQVVIESLIAEVTADKAAEFGIQWQDLSGLNSDNTRVISGTNFNSTAGGSNIIGAAQNLTSLGPGLNIGVVRGQVNIPGIGQVTNLAFLARALETKAHANILSQPNIQTLDNEEARFLVGQNVPFITGSYSNTGTTSTSGAVNPFQTFERKDVGLQLRVKPQISEGGTIKLAIYLENSSVVPGTSSGGLIINKRAFESNLLVEDGDFVVLSGLIEDSSSTSVSKVPLLGDLPLIGNLFRYENRDRSKTNTMVFLRPTIIRSAATATALAADRYDYMKTQIVDSKQPESLIFHDYNVDPSAVVPPRSTAPQGAAPATDAKSAASSAPAAAASAIPVPRTQLIQLEAVTDVERGRQIVSELRDAGYDAYWEGVNTDRGEIIRIRVAVDRTRQNADQVIADLKARGHQPILVAQ